MKVRRPLWLDAPLKPRSRYSVRNQIASAFGEMPSGGPMEMPSLGASYRVSPAFGGGLLVLEPRSDQSSASSSRSSPQKISLPITNVGEPNIPSERAVSVSASYFARTADPFARARTAAGSLASSTRMLVRLSRSPGACLSQTNLGMLLSHRKHTSPPRLLARRHGWPSCPDRPDRAAHW